MRRWTTALVIICTLLMGGGQAFPEIPVEKHGQLAVSDGQLVDAQGEPVSLAGVSWFWSTTGWEQERFYNSDAVSFLAEDWNISLVRAALSVEPEGGVLTDPDGNVSRINTLVQAAIDEGLYVIVDWHAHAAEKNTASAVAYFTAMAKIYGDKPNVIYEIYNEPLENTDWDSVIKPYAEEVVSAIRAIDPDNIILIGTQAWSQDVDKAAANPLTGYDNLMYTLHFYAGTHGEDLRDKARTAMDKGIALFVSEWGTVNADGDGGVAGKNLQAWRDFMKEHKLSHANWALSDKQEGAAILKPGVSSTGPWGDEDLTESGLYVREMLRTWSVD